MSNIQHPRMVMDKMRNITVLFLLIWIIAACSKDTDTVDMDYPVIDMSYIEAFPVQCGVVNRGETFIFKARFTDNAALGSFGVDIHHNFDQHSHSTEVQTCVMDGRKEAVDPFVYIRSFDISDNPRVYEAELEIDVPAGVDPGDYHLMIRVTDREGWQTMRGLSIKIQ